MLTSGDDKSASWVKISTKKFWTGESGYSGNMKVLLFGLLYINTWVSYSVGGGSISTEKWTEKYGIDCLGMLAKACTYEPSTIAIQISTQRKWTREGPWDIYDVRGLFYFACGDGQNVDLGNNRYSTDNVDGS